MVFLDSSDGNLSVEPRRAAKINDDGRITDIPPVAEYASKDNVFTAFNGAAVEQMKAEAERAKAWQATYSE